MSYNFQPEEYVPILKSIFHDAYLLKEDKKLDIKSMQKVIRRFPKSHGKLFAKYELLKGYNYLIEKGELVKNAEIEFQLRMKPTRSISGVLPLTVLTKPYPCPGKCIFCPNDVRMPKSYLSDEPGAQRAERNNFDPYLQTFNRLKAFASTGHTVSKVELIILGGTWSYYPEAYQIWFIKRCFEALNDFGNKDQRSEVELTSVNAFNTKVVPSEAKLAAQEINYNQAVAKVDRDQLLKEKASWDELEKLHIVNSTSNVKCVGLVIETRPDHISEKEVLRVRRLGATKTQIGFQSLSDKVLELNKRGHLTAATRRAVSLVRSAGFKIHAHWMPNLYGSDPTADKLDFAKLWTPDYQPDELKIYPCSLIASAELMQYFEKGLWKPYTREELLDVLTYALSNTPRYVRLTRVIRDIPSTDIVVGNKLTNFRELVEQELKVRKIVLQDIRSREIKGELPSEVDISLKITSYDAKNSYGETREHFIEFITTNDKICGFLRLSLPKSNLEEHFVSELKNTGIIREVHVYGTSIAVGEKSGEGVQHLGLGKKLIAKAEEMSREAGFTKLAVISAIGTRGYYDKLGYNLIDLYQVKDL